MEQLISKLFSQQGDVIAEFESRDIIDRDVYGQISYDNNITGIIGLRGVGKTTWLLKEAVKHYAKERKALYLSADNILLDGTNLLELVEYLYKKTNCDKLYIDEIHKYPNWAQELKNISDLYSSFRVVFTGSSAIDIVRSKYDLSRRVTLIHLPGLSFREYIKFSENLDLGSVGFEDLLANPLEVNNSVLGSLDKPLLKYSNYLKHGYYPLFRNFSSDLEVEQAIENSVEKSIYEDIGTVYQYRSQNLLTIERLFNFIINSSAGELNITKLAAKLEKDFETTSNYLHSLQQSGLVIGLYNQSTGDKFLRNPEKAYPANTAVMTAKKIPMNDSDRIGKFREVFALSHIKQIYEKIFYTKSGDLFVDGQYYLEIGGKSKTMKQVKDVNVAKGKTGSKASQVNSSSQKKSQGYVFADNITTPSISGRIIPLYLLGLLY